MEQIVAFLIFILSLILPIIYNVYIIKKITLKNILFYSFFVLILFILFFYFLKINNNDELNKYLIFIIGTPIILLFYIYSFICLIKIIKQGK